MGAYKSLGAAQMLDTKQYTHYHADPIRYEPLEDLLVWYRDQECNDLRDRVYGLMGLADPQFKIAVDYGKLPHQAFMDAVLAIILNEAGPLPNQPLRWTRAGDSQSICELAERMGCTAPQVRSLRVLMKFLWKLIRRHVYKGRHCPFTAMGFEQADAITGTSDRWWLDFYGLRYYVECSESASQAEILQSLEKDYETIRLEDDDDENWETEDEDDATVSHQA
jgi:hypothetical protein